MRDFIAKISLTALFALAIFSASAAEKVTFEASSPLTVAVGEAFRVEFALNAYPDKGTFKAPSFEGFDVIAGPAESSGQSIQIVNGAMTKASITRSPTSCFRRPRATSPSGLPKSRWTAPSTVPTPSRSRS